MCWDDCATFLYAQLQLWWWWWWLLPMNTWSTGFRAGDGYLCLSLAGNVTEHPVWTEKNGVELASFLFCRASHKILIYYNNNNVLFYVLFLRIGTHSPLQSKEPKHSQIKLTHTCAGKHTHMHARTNTCTHTHTHRCDSQWDSLKRWDFKGDLKDVSVFDDLTLQGRLFQTDGAT